MKFALAVVGFLSALAPAHAETLTFHLNNATGKSLQVRLFSQTRAWQWPSATSSYVLKKKKTGSYPITCNAGEQVCYGAWPTKKPTSWGWGVGPGTMKCTACCYMCGATTGTTNLNPETN
jgi:hypothetical protein